MFYEKTSVIWCKRAPSLPYHATILSASIGTSAIYTWVWLCATRRQSNFCYTHLIFIFICVLLLLLFMILNDVANNETWQNCKYTKSLPNPIANISTHTLSRPHTFSPAYSHIPTHSPIWLRNKRAPVNRKGDCRQLTISAGRITVRKLKNILKKCCFYCVQNVQQ